jgi:dipeptidyl aminopeptidase/acylaminoacyl peptidase
MLERILKGCGIVGALAMLGGCAVTPGMDFSPDGTRLVVPWGRDLQLYSTRADGTGAEPLPETEGAYWPRWSPDGRYLLFVTEGGVKLYDPTVRRVVREIEGGRAPFAWSPDSRRFVVTAARGEDGPPEARWYAVDRPEPLAGMELPFEDASVDAPAVWLRGTETFAVIAGSGGGNVHLVGPEGTSTVTTTGDVIGLSASAGGRKLLWARAAPHPKGVEVSLFSHDPGRGATAKLPFRLVLTGESAEVERVVFSPDGARLAFVAWRDGKGVVYTVNVSGGEPRAVHTAPRQETQGGEDVQVALSMHWSPDGSKLAVMQQGTSAGVRIYDAESLEGRDLPLPNLAPEP